MGRVGFWRACMQVVLLWEVTASGTPGWLRYVYAPYLFCSPPFLLLGFWFVIVLFINLFKNGFVGLKESTSLWVEIPVGVRLPTAGSPQTPRKWDPHWELLLVACLYCIYELKVFDLTLICSLICFGVILSKSVNMTFKYIFE